MYSILIFLLTISPIPVNAIRYRTLASLILFGGALFFGIASGMPLNDLVSQAIAGMGRIVALSGLVMPAGAVIAKLNIGAVSG